MGALDKIRLRHASLSGRVVLARFGKDPRVALETRDAQDEFLQAIVSYSFDGKMPSKGEGVDVSFGAGDEQFVMTVRRIESAALSKASPSEGGEGRSLSSASGQEGGE